MIKDGKKLMEEIDKVYKDLKISSRNNSYRNSNSDYSNKKFGFYDYSKKSFLDNKTNIKAGYGYYGRLE